MKLLATIILFASFTTASFAGDALGIQVRLEGDEAERLMEKVMSTEGAQLVENSVGVTTWAYEEVSCSLYGSHRGSPEADHPAYICIGL